MFKRHLWELSKSFGSQIDPEKSEELKRTKIDIENNLTRVLKLLKSEEKSKKETELVGLIEDFYNQYQSLYVLYGRLTGENAKTGPPPSRTPKRMSLSSFSSASSDSEYFSSEETEINNNNNNNNERYYAFVNNTLHALKNTTTTTTTTATTQPSSSIEANALRKLELEVENQASEIKQLRGKNAELEVAVSMLHAKLKLNEEQAMSTSSDFTARINKLEQEVKSLGTQKCKFEEKMKRSRSIKKEFTVMQQNFKELEAKLAETCSAERNVLQEKEFLVTRMNELCSRENDLERKLRDEKEKHEKEMKELKEKVDEKEEKELVLREKVWKLEGDVSKEGGEKLNLVKEVRQLERRVERLEKNVKEKDDELVYLGEKKREAIRQLCFLVEFHRDRCFYLKDLILRLRIKNKTSLSLN